MPDIFLIHALIAGFGVALMTAPLGCLIAWHRLSYFGDTIAHAALLGVVLALLSGVAVQLGIIVVALLVVFLVTIAERNQQLAYDTLLGVAAHGALALGLVILALSDSIRIDINGLLFGDILAVGRSDIWLIYGACAVILAIVAWCWKDLLRMTIHADIAQVENVNTRSLRLVMMVLIALSVAVSIKIVGILLITSMLIIPAATARYFARTPTQMAFVAALLGILAVSTGLFASLQYDIPSGPTIILAALAGFVGSATIKKVG